MKSRPEEEPTDVRTPLTLPSGRFSELPGCFLGPHFRLLDGTQPTAGPGAPNQRAGGGASFLLGPSLFLIGLADRREAEI
jgi:hypothetical protein